MADVADYRVIRDGSVTLKTGADIDKHFNFDLGTAVQHGQRVILQFFYVSSSNANKLDFNFSINGNSIRTIRVTGNSFGTVHEVAKNVTNDHSNQLKVEIVGGSGEVKVSDIVLWVQRTV